MTVGEATIDAASRWPDGGASAGSLLLTVLGEFVHPRGGPVWTAALVTGLAALGIEEKAARQAIARTAAKGLLKSEKSGRRVSWHITRSGTRLLTEGTRRIYGFLTDPSPWDGQWLVLSVGVPETQRQLRQRLRTRLTWLGMGSPSPGIWILPDVSKVGEVETIVDELGLGDKAFAWTGKLTTIGKAETLIGDAWSLTEVEGRYADFLATFGTLRATTPLRAFQAQVRLVHAWRQFPFLDPALPRELLDHDWPGPQAAALFHRRHDEWHAPAQQYWTELEAIS